MPRIWLDFCQFLVDQGLITRTRRTFDRALRALAITQHDRIWQLYLKFVKMYDLPEMAVRVYRRYLRVSWGYCCGTESFIDISNKSFPKIWTLKIKSFKKFKTLKKIDKNGNSKFWQEIKTLKRIVYR